MVTPDLTIRAALGFAQMGCGFVDSGAVAQIGSPPLASAAVSPVVSLTEPLIGFAERERA